MHVVNLGIGLIINGSTIITLAARGCWGHPRQGLGNQLVVRLLNVSLLFLCCPNV